MHFEILMRRKYFALTTILAIFSFAQISYANCIEKDDLPVCMYSNDTEKDCDNNLAIGAISAAYNRLSEPVQKLFCTVKEVHENLDSWSLAQYDWTASTIYLDMSALSEPFSLAIQNVFIDQQNFEFDERRTVYTWSDDEATGDFAYSDESGLFSIIVHELGHYLENIAGVGYPFHCAASEQTQRSSQYFGLASNCVEHRCQVFSSSLAREYYPWLNQSSYVSTYATYNPAEDFAETFKSYNFEHIHGVHFQVEKYYNPIFPQNRKNIGILKIINMKL